MALSGPAAEPAALPEEAPFLSPGAMTVSGDVRVERMSSRAVPDTLTLHGL